MRSSPAKSAMVFLIIFSTLVSQTLPNLAAALYQDKLQVAFVGLKFENVPERIRDTLSWRMAAILESQESLSVVTPDAAVVLYGRDKLAALVDRQEFESFLAFARRFQFDHVYSGTLANQSPDSNRVFLVGELNRYDLSTGSVNTFKINKDYNQFGNDLVRFKKDYVDALVTDGDSRKSLWTVGILLGALIAAVIIVGSAGGFGGSEGGDPEPTDE